MQLNRLYDPAGERGTVHAASQLVPPDILAKPGKMLFVTHLALGDFTYLQAGFRAFAQAYPHIKVHLWVDEVLRTADSSRWEYLRKQALYDWLAACPFFDKVYSSTYSPALFEESLREARQQDYPLVVSLATLRPHQYARLARKISPHGFVVGIRKREGPLALRRHLAYRQLDAALPMYTVSKQHPQHISDIHADWFRQLFGIRIAPEARFPTVQIPQQWTQRARKLLAEWGFDRRGGKLVFINPYSKTKKRSWPLERVAELVMAMSARDQWRDACFIINATPQQADAARKAIDGYALERTRVFSAQENFFELPAILAECDLVISVETATMHLANAVHVPLVALMRQKSPEWAPIDSANSIVITTARRRDWVSAITPDQVMKVVQAI